MFLLKRVNLSEHIHGFTHQQSLLYVFSSFGLVFVQLVKWIKTLKVLCSEVVFDWRWFSALKNVLLKVFLADEWVAWTDCLNHWLWVAEWRFLAIFLLVFAWERSLLVIWFITAFKTWWITLLAYSWLIFLVVLIKIPLNITFYKLPIRLITNFLLNFILSLRQFLTTNKHSFLFLNALTHRGPLLRPRYNHLVHFARL